MVKDRTTSTKFPSNKFNFTALIICRQTTHYPTEKRKFSFFCHRTLKKSAHIIAHYLAPTSHNTDTARQRAIIFANPQKKFQTYLLFQIIFCIHLFQNIKAIINLKNQYSWL